ncbi:hypothetical protein MAPG_09111 [Magnaporthiopsis poae ATCC 64411]|uniref:Low-temperature viability protein ltv1 n=1 Tax=Magnaporthiopsis poae (strain ATCC 64411 / 73-15) TaxID=644358 RepID=A0A0C4E934_MAGP6|nr:hypothetical protein MAPG_09111 [Magnaporthiopsis poae ATCC 64411]
MARGKWIDKKTATHFTLVHRPQNDPLIHDESAPSMVLNPTQPPNASSSKGKKLDDLASELGSDALSIRDNEGEAANHGIYFDDTEYDYMQHMRDLGAGEGEAVFVEAKIGQKEGKGKQKQSLEDALREMDLQNRSSDLLDAEILPTRDLPRATYQAQQDVPDAIAGFQPDMDPRLREVLEALEDEAYVDEDGDDDLFRELAKDAKELKEHEFEDEFYDGEDGWESDATAKPGKDSNDDCDDEAPQLVRTGEQPNEGPSQEWLEDFKQFKKDQGGERRPAAAAARTGAAAPSELQSSVWTTTTSGGRRKKRKGALTDKTGHSMTSASLVRTEGLSLLDARFERIEEEYTADFGDDELGSVVSGMSTASSVQGPMRSDFDGILDDFLGAQPNRGGKRGKKHYKGGLAELDEIRKGLGPARISTR